MPPNQDPFTDAKAAAKLLEQQYTGVMEELKTVARNAAREEVERIAAASEADLKRVLGDAVAAHRGAGIIPRPQATHVLGVLAVVLLLWLVYPRIAGRSGSDDAVVGTGGDPVSGEVQENLPPIERGPLHQVAAERYDSLFARRDPAIQRLIVDAPGAATLDSTVAAALARWTPDSVTAANDLEIVHAAAFQAALRKLTGGRIDSPVNGEVNRADCAQDEYCRTLVTRWRMDRSTGMRLLPPVSDNRLPNANELMPVEKLVIYSQLSP